MCYNKFRFGEIMKKSKINYLIIILYCIILIAVFLGFNNLYGSNTDWISQHSVIPDYFRKIFYETKNLIPDLAINLGAGQNIFNYGYYGLLSPIILFSYLLPFVKMSTYIIFASIFLYISSGLLMYYFLKENTLDNNKSLLLSIIFVTLSPMTYHFHHHIMFVWYMPFLIMSLIGVDKYLKGNKSFLLMISIFLVIMTNYYYSVGSIIVIVLYAIYKILDNKKLNIKKFLLELFKFFIRIFVPILMSTIIIIPTFYVIVNSERLLNENVSLISLIYPNIKEVVYKTFSMGLSAIFLLAPISLLCVKNRKRNEIFLSICMLVITLIPLFMYILNGLLYIRGKVLIPFIPIYIILLALFIKNIKEKNIDYKKLGIGALILIMIALFDNYQDGVLISFGIDVIISFILILLVNKYNNKYIICIPLLIFLVINAYFDNKSENYVSIDKYNNINTEVIDELLTYESIGYYRTLIDYYPLENANKYYNENYYSATIYSSNYNEEYHNFYNFVSGNNIVYRNKFVLVGENNELFNNIMGIKYIISKNNPGFGYKEIKKIDDLTLYENALAYPLVYATNKVGNINKFNSLDFPYNLEYMLNNPIVEDGNNTFNTNILKLNWDLESEYEFSLDEDTKYTYMLPDKIKNKYLIIEFNMDYNESCSKGDTKITINGETNKLTCSSWMYHNENYQFEYVLSSNEEIDKLNIEISKGKYKINDINIYVMDYIENNYQEIDNLVIDKKNSTIKGEVNLDEDSYVITSIPYSDGFKILVDDVLQDVEIVNTAFVGFKVSSGFHKIEIIYNAPGKIIGILGTIVGFLSLIAVLIYEKFEDKFLKLFKKYKEIIMYLIFGVLTTIVSIASYMVFTHTILNPNNSFELQIANVLSWILSVIFAYITNRMYVFSSKNKNIIKEIISFFSSRVVTLLLDMFLMFILVTCLYYNDAISKIIVQVIVIIGNYILSKLIVFKKEK